MIVFKQTEIHIILSAAKM